MEFNENGTAIRGSYAISTVSIGGGREDGSNVPMLESAVCDICGGWATTVHISGKGTNHGDFIDARISRRLQVIVYACLEHADAVADALVDEFGFATNRYEPDDLAGAVEAADRSRFLAR